MDLAWEIVYPLAALLLALAIAWGIVQSRRRSSRERRITEAATHELYENPGRYERETHDKLQEAAEREQRRQSGKG